MLVISTPEDLPRFEELLGDGSQWGMRFAYAAQPKPEGWRRRSSSARDFVGGDSACLILGDNIFYGHGLTSCSQRGRGARRRARPLRLST